ncbi:MAG: penicillin-binding protein 2 [Parcubacteria group bacterium Gr01-1014_13]|nr:MAG: penicillin-binding protein 2 [Parcubacteria group bacterium Gr01-1014_13]
MAELFNISEDKIQHGDLEGKYNHNWVEESFNFEAKAGKQVPISHTKTYLGTSILKKKIFFMSLVVAIGLGIIAARTAYLQIVRGSHYRGLAEGNRIRLQPIFSERGIIYDRFHTELVENVPNFSLTMIPQDLPRDLKKREAIIDTVVNLSGVPKEKIQDLLKRYSSYSYASLVVKENLDYQSALKLYIQSSQLPGISIEKGSKRKYIAGDSATSSVSSASHFLGYLAKLNDEEIEKLKDKGYLLFDNIGKSGLEKTYESDLRGKYGIKKIEVDALGHEQTVLAEEPPQPGKNLVLTLDLEAQKKLEELLKNMLVRANKKRAAAVAMDPRDGSILAMVSLPAFDNNEFSGGITQKNYNTYINNPDNPLFNRAIGGTYPSGSTVKPIVSAAALQEKIITANTTFLSTGGLQLGDRFFRDWKPGGHGTTDVKRALAWSVNTFYYYIGGGYKSFVGLGVDRIIKYMQYFGIAQKSGIDIPGEATGFVPSKEWKSKTKGEIWFVGDTYNLSIGQGDLLVTPLQVAVWTAAVANGGQLVQPHLADKLEEPVTDKEVSLKFNKQSVPISPENFAIVRQGMKDCVSYGSCQMMKSLPFASGGKTGTAQWNSNKENHAWFTAFAPFDSPKIVVTVLIEEGVEGAVVAEPVARDFLAWWGKKYPN